MAWATSGLFTGTVMDYLIGVIANTTADLDAAGALKLALYDNSITVNQAQYDTATRSSIAYGGGIWVTGGSQTGTTQVFHAGQWAQGGVALTGAAVTQAGTGIVKFAASNTASGSACTMSNIYGGLMYIDALTTPVADQALLGVYFGGTGYSVTNGTFTVQWNGSGIFTLTIA